MSILWRLVVKTVKRLILTYISQIKLFVTGLFMGTAGLIPGVSSGTVAVICGVYEEMIKSFKALTTKKERKLKPIVFLVILFSGIIVSSFITAFIIEYLMTNFPIYTQLFIIGLIIGTIPLLYRKTKSSDKEKQNIVLFKLIPFIIGIGIVLWVGMIKTERIDINIQLSLTTLILLFFAGFVASGTGIIPGVSGSMVLLALGLYNPLIAAINQRHIVFLLVLASGAFVGFVFFSRVISALLLNYEQIAYYMIIGLLIGSAINLLPEEILDQQLGINIISIVVTSIGFLLAYFIGGEKKNVKSDYI